MGKNGKKVLVSFAIGLAIYLGSYCIVARNREVGSVEGDYRILRMRNAVISDDASFVVYKPLIWLDELTLGPEDDLYSKPE